jgi:uncharacterized protein YlxP (DUF503 family)
MPGRACIAVLRVTLHVPASGSLKAKRQVVSGLLRSVRMRHQVAAAEVGERDLWQVAHIVVASVSADAGHAESVIAQVLRHIERGAGDAVVTDVSTETLRL